MKSFSQRRLTLGVLAVLVLCPAIARSQQLHCAGHQDVGVGIDAVQAYITVAPNAVTSRAAAWCGMDYSAQFWVQAGWLQFSNQVPTFYYEWFGDDGSSTFPVQIGDAVSATYNIYLNGTSVIVAINFIPYVELQWSKFDLRGMCHLQAGAEVLGTTERVPGAVGSECEISSVSYRLLGSQFYTPASLTAFNNTYCGALTILASGVKFWDKRGWTESECP